MVGVPGIAERLFRTLAAAARQRHPDLAGVVRAHDLLRRPRRRRRARRSRRSSSEFRFEVARQLMIARSQARPGDPRGGRRRHEGTAGRVGQGVRRARPQQHQHQRDRAGRVGAQHLVRDRRRAAGAGAERDPPGVLRDAQARSRWSSSASATSAARCCGSCTSSGSYLLSRGLRRRGSSPSPTAGGSSSIGDGIDLARWTRGARARRGGRWSPAALAERSPSSS